MDNKALSGLIATFVRRPDALACRDVDQAFGACGPISRRFAAAARAAGLQASIAQLSRWADDGFADRVLLHDVVVVEGVVVDWSARQFVGHVEFDGRTPRLAKVAVPYLVPLDPDGAWPPEAAARDGVTIWDSVHEIVALDAPLGPGLESQAADWQSRWQRMPRPKER